MKRIKSKFAVILTLAIMVFTVANTGMSSALEAGSVGGKTDKREAHLTGEIAPAASYVCSTAETLRAFFESPPVDWNGTVEVDFEEDTLTQEIKVDFTAIDQTEVTIVSSLPAGTTLHVPANKRHMVVTSTGTGTLNLDGIVLDGQKIGGGIQVGNMNADSSGDVTIYGKNGAALQNNYALSNGGLQNGGGVIVQSKQKLTVSGDLEIIGNHANLAGGGIYLDDDASGGLIVKDDVKISGNSAGMRGGGIEIRGGDTTISDNVKIESNNAKYLGGGIYLSGDIKLTISDNVEIFGNRIDATGNYGGGAIATYDGDLHIKDNVAIRSNSSDGANGGGIFMRSPSADYSVKLENDVLFSENTARYGGAIALANEGGISKAYVMDSVTFEENSSTQGVGGAIRALEPDNIPNVASTVTFRDNTSPSYLVWDKDDPLEDLYDEFHSYIHTASFTPLASEPDANNCYNNFDIGFSSKAFNVRYKMNFPSAPGVQPPIDYNVYPENGTATIMWPNSGNAVIHGSDFQGWSYDEDASVPDFSYDPDSPPPSTTMAESLVLYGVWEDLETEPVPPVPVETIKVTFDGRSGAPASQTGTAVVGRTYKAALNGVTEPVRDNYSFVGWFTSPTGGTEVTEATAVSQTEDHTLYAQWTLDKDLGLPEFSERPDPESEPKQEAESKQESRAQTDTPQTGDNNNIILFFLLFLISGLSLAGFGAMRLNRRKQSKD